MSFETILIIDFGSQYTQLIARRVRELGVYSEIHPYDCCIDDIIKLNPVGVILSGGPESVTQAGSPRIPDAILALNCPILGICYGMQSLVAQSGGSVRSVARAEFGLASIQCSQSAALFAGLDPILNVWMSHGDSVIDLPKDFECIASTESCPIVAIAHRHKPWFGLQFHPEVTHTEQGAVILNHFLKTICGCSERWVNRNIIEEAIAQVREQVKGEKVILALSGGVDSSVLAALLHRAIGQQLQCVFVDTGLLRLNEGDNVMTVMGEHLQIPIIRVNAQNRFLNALKGLTDPELKRKAIGRLFIDIFQETASTLPGATWLAQGTIYSDVIESAKTVQGKAQVIKSHHNVGGLPDNMRLKLLEPLRELFKDEVRAMGLALGLPSERIDCHPFPGPGLAVRVLGEVKAPALEILRQADAIFMRVLRNFGWYHKTAQAFAVYVPQKSVAVMGDGRVYADFIALRAVESIDYMTARWAHLPYELLNQAATEIMNEVKGISRVVYDITGKPPATIEWE